MQGKQWTKIIKPKAVKRNTSNHVYFCFVSAENAGKCYFADRMVKKDRSKTGGAKCRQSSTAKLAMDLSRSERERSGDGPADLQDSLQVNNEILISSEEDVTPPRAARQKKKDHGAELVSLLKNKQEKRDEFQTMMINVLSGMNREKETVAASITIKHDEKVRFYFLNPHYLEASQFRLFLSQTFHSAFCPLHDPSYSLGTYHLVSHSLNRPLQILDKVCLSSFQVNPLPYDA